MPEVSVVIPSYNAAAYVGQAIESVLAQTFQDFEVIVVDDGSTDDTEAVISAFGPQVKQLRQPNSGVSAARNRGIAESQGRYVGLLDSDDCWLPEKLEKQLIALGEQRRSGFCYTAWIATDADLEPLETRRPQSVSDPLEALLLEGNIVGVGSSTVLCERELLVKIGGYDSVLSQCADWDLWIRLAVLTDFCYVDEPLIKYRRHAMSMSNDPRLLETDSLRVLEKGFALPGIDPSLAERRRQAFARNYMVCGGTYFQARRYRDFARCAALSVRLDPRHAGYLAAYPLRVARRLSARTASG